MYQQYHCIWRPCDRASWQIIIIKPTSCTNFSNLFLEWNSTCFEHSFVHHQEFFTVNTAMVYVIQVCWQLACRIRMFHRDPAGKLSTNLYDIYHCCVYSEELLMMDKWIFLGFVSPCIIIYSNKSTNQMHQSLRFIASLLNTPPYVSGILMPIIRSLSTAVAVSGLPFTTFKP